MPVLSLILQRRQRFKKFCDVVDAKNLKNLSVDIKKLEKDFVDGGVREAQAVLEAFEEGNDTDEAARSKIQQAIATFSVGILKKVLSFPQVAVFLERHAPRRVNKREILTYWGACNWEIKICSKLDPF